MTKKEIGIDDLDSFLKKLMGFAAFYDDKIFEYKKYGKYDIRYSFYSSLVGVINNYIHMFNSSLLYFLLYANPLPVSVLDDPKFDEIMRISKENVLSKLGWEKNKEKFNTSLNCLLVMGIGSEYLMSVINGGMLSLYIGIASTFESVIGALFDVVCSGKEDDSKIENIKKICEIVDIKFDSLETEKIDKLKKLVKEYPFTSKLGSLIALSGKYKDEYKIRDKTLFEEVYEIRNSQHNRGVRKDGSIAKVLELNPEIDKLMEFVQIFEKILDGLALTEAIDTSKTIEDKTAKIIREETALK